MEQQPFDFAPTPIGAPEPSPLPRAIAGGVIGALAGGAAWAAIAIVSEYEIGYMAVGVGILAGIGVSIATRDRLLRSAPIVAAACSLAGLLIGKYLIFAHFAIAQLAQRDTAIAARTYSWDPRIALAFFALLPQILSMADALFGVIALGAAWKITSLTLADRERKARLEAAQAADTSLPPAT